MNADKENDSSDVTPVVFVDTSYLTYMPADEVADWNKLLLLSKSGQVEIRISEIAANEYRTKSRDDLDSAINRAQTALSQLQKKWNASPFARTLGDPVAPDVFPTLEDTEKASHAVLENLESSGVKIVRPADDHGDRTWRKYFSWTGVFGKTPPSERDNPSVRESRRKHIPDAWISEAALDVYEENGSAICLCKDENLCETLLASGLNVKSKGVEIIEYLESIQNRTTDTKKAGDRVETVQPEEETSEADPTQTNALEKRLGIVAESGRKIQLKILGYAQWFDPLPKSKLIELLDEKGHSRAQSENAIENLMLQGLIQDVGGHVIVADGAVGELAKQEVMEEILEILNQE